MGRARGEDGLTLLEVLVAALILGLVLVAVFQLFSVGTRVDLEQRRHLEALRLAESELERIKAGPFEAVEASAPRQEEGRYATYRITVTVDEHDDGKTVTVTVAYPTNGGEKTVRLAMERGRW